MKAVVATPSEEPVGGVPLCERLIRSLKAAGVDEVVVLDDEQSAGSIEDVTVRSDGGENGLVYVDGRHYLDGRIIEAVLARSGTYLCLDDRDDVDDLGDAGEISVSVEGDGVSSVGSDDGEKAWVGIARLDGVERVGADPTRFLESVVARNDVGWLDLDAIDTYVSKLRRAVPLYWVRVTDDRSVRRAEYAVLDSSRKNPSDLVAALVHDPIENRVVARLARYPVTPNQLTALVNVLAYVATALFALGYLLPASLLTFAVGLADGFDGKLARLTERKTRVGAMEHSFDLLFEFSWIVALAFYLSGEGDPRPLLLAAVIVTLVAFYRHVYDRFGDITGVSLDTYGDFEESFRRIAGRRNLYNVHILVFVVLGAPAIALYTIAAHALLTAVVYSSRAMMWLRRLDRES